MDKDGLDSIIEDTTAHIKEWFLNNGGPLVLIVEDRIIIDGVTFNADSLARYLVLEEVTTDETRQ